MVVRLTIAACALLGIAGCSDSGLEETTGSSSVIRPERLSEPTSSSAAAFTSDEFNAGNGLSTIRAAEAYAARTMGVPGGENQRIAIIDSGLDVNHPDISENAIAFTFNSFGLGDETSDTNGHGTHVAGTATARRDGTGIHGVAYKSTPISIKVFRDVDTSVGGSENPLLGFASDAAIAVLSAAGISESVQRFDPFGVPLTTLNEFGFEVPDIVDTNPAAESAVMNMSFGSGADPLFQFFGAMVRAAEREKIMVAALGNDGGATPRAAPAIYVADPQLNGLAIAVAALDETGEDLADFSTRCGAVRNACISAPGTGIISTVPGGGYGAKRGTSMAAPHVAGAAAFALAAFPGVPPAEIVNRMFVTADDLGAAGVDFVFGHGRLNMEAMMSPVGTTSVPTGTLVSGSSVATSAFGAAAGPGSTTTSLLSGTDGMMMLDSMGFPFQLDLGTRIEGSVESNVVKSFVSGSTGSVQARVLGGNARVSGMREDRFFTGFDTAAGSGRDGGLALQSSRFDADLPGGFGFGFATGVGVGAASGAPLSNMVATGPLGSTLGGASVTPFSGSGTEVTLRYDADPQTRMTFAHHTGDGWDGEVETRTLRFGIRHAFDGAFDGVEAGVHFDSLTEDGSVAGARYDGFLNNPGAQTTAFGIDAAWHVSDSVTVAAGYGIAATSATDGNGDLMRLDQQLSDTATVALSAKSPLGEDHRMVFSAAMPFAAVSGDAMLNVPIGRTFGGAVVYDQRRISLAPEAREQNLQAVYSMPLFENGTLDLAGFFRLNADHVAGETDLGAAVRFDLEF